MLIPDEDRKLCPNIEAPHADCYCNNLTSQDIEKAIYYCAKNFNSCKIYIESNTDLLQNTPDSIPEQDGYTETPS